MYDLFYNYLLVNHKAVLPGLGSFSIENVPAKLDFVTQSLSAPAQKIVFNANHSVIDKQFFFYLSKELKVSEQEAGNQLNQFAQKVKDNALNGGIELPGIGSLQKSSADEVYFVPKHNILSVLPNINLRHSIASGANLVDLYDAGNARIIKQSENAPPETKIETTDKEDYWWVYAIILAVMGLGALLYYYI
ncbi:MAG: hypothetical protein J0I09_12490 [Sphingobacteriia bacterium]|nr:hypothetical protein [Sphingobacteriia bacterium]